jgi:hypothetical protein
MFVIGGPSPLTPHQSLAASSSFASCRMHSMCEADQYCQDFGGLLPDIRACA